MEPQIKLNQNHLLKVLTFSMVSFVLGFIFFKGGPIENFLGDMIGGFAFFIGIICLLGGSIKAFSLYQTTKDSKFLIFVLLFLIISLGVFLYGSTP